MLLNRILKRKGMNRRIITNLWNLKHLIWFFIYSASQFVLNLYDFVQYGEYDYFFSKFRLLWKIVLSDLNFISKTKSFKFVTINNVKRVSLFEFTLFSTLQYFHFFSSTFLGNETLFTNDLKSQHYTILNINYSHKPYFFINT